MKDNTLEEARSSLRSSYKERFQDRNSLQGLGFIPWGISTQSLVLDLCIGRPGIPGGRITQVLGLDGEGKSTVVMHLIAECLRLGGYVAVADTEGAYETYRLYQLGVKKDMLDRLLFLEVTTLEEVYDQAKIFIQTMGSRKLQVPILLAVDSMDGVHSDKLMDADIEDSIPAADARCNGTNIPKLGFWASKYKIAVVLVSQLTTKMQQGFAARWTGPELETKGGKAIRYRASLRLHVKKGKVEEEKEGLLTKVDIIKNKLAPPFKQAFFRLDFDHGIDKYQDLWDGVNLMGLLSGGQGGRWNLTLKKQTIPLFRKQWPSLVDRYGGPDSFREKLLRKAIRNGLIRPYGVDEIPLEESNQEREPTLE